MRETMESNLCTAPSSLLSRTSYYLKPDEEQAPGDLARKGVKPVRGIMAATGETLTPDAKDSEEEE
jgi:hypothetical protein